MLRVIKEATDTFGNIAAKPTDNDMSRMKRTLLSILLKITYDQVEATNNLSGIILRYAKYIEKYGTAFQCPTCPKPYSPTITTTISYVKLLKDEAVHSACKEDYLL